MSKLNVNLPMFDRGEEFKRIKEKGAIKYPENWTDPTVVYELRNFIMKLKSPIVSSSKTNLDFFKMFLFLLSFANL